MAHNDFEYILDQLRRIKKGGDSNVVKIETLEMELRFLRTFINYPHVLSPDSFFKITKKVQLIVEMLHSAFGAEWKSNLHLEKLVSQLQEFTEDNTGPMFSFELNGLEYMDYLEQNLDDASRYLVRFNPFFTEKISILQKTDRFLKQVKIIRKKIRFMRYVYATKIKGYVDHEKLEDFITQVQFMADHVGQFCLALWISEDEDDTSNIESKPSYLLSLVVLVELEMKKIFFYELKASKFTQSRSFKDKKLPNGFSHHLQSLLVYLREQKLKNFPSKVSAQNIDVAIEFLLLFLADVTNRFIDGKRWNEVLERVGALVGDILCVTQKLLPGSTIEDDASEINLGTIEILEKTENLKAQVEVMYKSLKFTQSQFPTVGGLSFLDSLLRKLKEMWESERGLNMIMKPDIGILVNELSSLTSVFKVHHEHELLQNIQRRTINLAYEAEVAIDSILAQYNSLWHLLCLLPTIIKEIKHISEEVTKMPVETLSLKPCSVVKPFEHLSTLHSNQHVNDEEIVGFVNEAKDIIQHLVQGSKDLDVIPIVGMGGLGKTTIAIKVYNNDMIVSRFDVRAWCCVTQTFNRRDLLQEILNQVTGSKDKIDKVDELADELRKKLKGKRYLIVLDDMWDVMAWDDLRLSFPDDKKGSRVMVTTQLEKLGMQVKHHTDPYSLPFLVQDESWELLLKKVFQKEGCPPELYDVSLTIAKRCKGLPLVIVLVAGILKKNKMEESWWHEVENSLLPYVGECEEYSLSTMQLSYDNLPDHLRPCLLYMGMFPEDNRIPVSKLIPLWIAEGFVQNIESGRLEEAAEGYLNDLVGSNVVMVSKRRYDGKAKYCQVHDVVLHFCREKSREERFMSAVKGHSIQCQHLGLNENRLCYHITNEPSKSALLLSSKMRKPFHQHTRSLIIYARADLYLISWITKLRLLKILDLSSFNIGHLSLATMHPLIHLKYLAACSNKFDFSPESHLRHLETVIVKTSDLVWLGDSFWKMEKLRHVDIQKAIFNFGYLENKEKGTSEESSQLENLRILRGGDFSLVGIHLVDVLLLKCPNLQELDISIPSLERFTRLQSIFSFYGPNYITPEFQWPLNLKKLRLCQCHITRSVASMIAKVPSLEYLLLHKPTFDQEEWCLGDIMFNKIKVLKLIYLDMRRWVASEESFPQLEKLVLKYCDKLEGIPLSFADIQTLKQIKLTCCFRKSLITSAVKIKEEVEGIEGVDRIHLFLIPGIESELYDEADTKRDESAWKVFKLSVIRFMEGSRRKF